MIAKTPRIRLITVPPYGANTRRFIRALATSNLVAFHAEVDGLPHYDYDYEGYNPRDYSPAKAQQIFAAHHEVDAEHFLAARREGESLVKVSGRFHEKSAPLVVAVKEEMGEFSRVLFFDEHLDMFGSVFDAGGFLRFLVEEYNLSPELLHQVGALFSHTITDGAIDWEQVIRDGYPQAVANPRQHYRQIAGQTLVAQALRGQLVIGAEGEGTQPRELSQGYLLLQAVEAVRRTLEVMWVKENGIELVGSPLNLPPTDNYLVSFDGDVGNQVGFHSRVSSLVPYFRQIRRANILAWHFAELDSPYCSYEPEELAGFVMAEVERDG